VILAKVRLSVHKLPVRFVISPRPKGIARFKAAIPINVRPPAFVLNLIQRFLFASNRAKTPAIAETATPAKAILMGSNIVTLTKTKY